MADTHFSKLVGKKQALDETLNAQPTNPRQGDFYFDTRNNRMAVYNGGQWVYRAFTTTTSTSTSTTTTSTSTTTTSTSTSTTSSTSTTTTTSTTTSL
jgi:hypothetical protein